MRVCLLVGCLLILCCSSSPAQEKPKRATGPVVGKRAPDIEAEDLDGNTFSLSEFRGKVVVIDFWGNW